LRSDGGDAVGRWADRVALLILVLDLVVALATFRDYGLGWDDYTHSQYGDLLLSLFGSGFSDQRAFSFVNLYYYGGGYDVASALAAKISPFTLFETRRLVGALIGIVGLATTWRLGRKLGGPVAGLIALALLATCPLYDGHMYINAKDAPFAVAMTILLLALVHAFEAYPEPSRRSTAFVGVGVGLAFGSRVLAALAIFSAVVALITVAVDEFQHRRRDALARLMRFIWLMLPALLIGYLLMGLFWPWSVLSPLNPLKASDYFSGFFEKPWRELYEGRLISVPDMPATYLPHIFLIKLPEIMLVLGLAGTAFTVAAGLSGKLSARRGGALFAVVMSAFFPILLAMVARPALYNGVRHFLFVIPPFAVLGGFAGAAIFEWARARGRAFLAATIAVFLAGIALPITELVRLHPYQYSSFNLASGGVAMAHDKYMVDYWGLAFKEASEKLRAYLDARGEKPPAGRRWIVEICGPQRGAEVALGPNFETTWDRKTVDFAMMLGTFYCRDDLKVPILVEVKREGELYARVYDLRGRGTPSLLTEPPP
jgi:4-amino-4-deoxy-L-arabinose transferase-like glycosyltransferase